MAKDVRKVVVHVTRQDVNFSMTKRHGASRGMKESRRKSFERHLVADRTSVRGFLTAVFICEGQQNASGNANFQRQRPEACVS